MSTQTLKAASESRIRTDYTEWQSTGVQQGHFNDLCPRGSYSLLKDEYGRLVSPNTINLKVSQCDAFAPFPHSSFDHIQRETGERPYIPIPPSGMRGSFDLNTRPLADSGPKNLYGADLNSNFLTHGPFSSHQAVIKYDTA